MSTKHVCISNSEVNIGQCGNITYTRIGITELLNVLVFFTKATFISLKCTQPCDGLFD